MRFFLALVQRFLVLLVLAYTLRVLLVSGAVIEGDITVDAGIVSLRASVVVFFGVLLGNCVVADLAVERDHRGVNKFQTSRVCFAVLSTEMR